LNAFFSEAAMSGNFVPCGTCFLYTHPPPTNLLDMAKISCDAFADSLFASLIFAALIG